MAIKLYAFGPTRSARCHWALLESGLPFEIVEDRALFGSDELRALHPLGKLPVAVIDGRTLFESAAICTCIADRAPQAGLIAAAGSWERALHDQWTSFCLSEMEAWLWSAAVNTFVLPEDRRIAAVPEQSGKLFKRAALALDNAMAGRDYLVGDAFSVTDIIVGYTVNWGRRQNLLDECPNLLGYLDRLLQRPHCTLSRD